VSTSSATWSSGGVTTTTYAAPAAPPAADPLAQPAPAAKDVRRLIVGYRPATAEAQSDNAAAQDAKAKGQELTLDRRLATGAVVVLAAGNSNADISGFTPASCNNVIAVAAGSRAFYSNFGAKVDITAPGGETRRGTVSTPQNGMLPTLNTGATTPAAETYTPYQGTSMAAPHIAGLAALVLGKNPALTPAQVETLIKNNARPSAGTCTGGCGAGLADAAETVLAAGGGTTPPGDALENPTDVQIPDNGAAVTSSITVSGKTGNAPSTLQVAWTSRTPTGATSWSTSSRRTGLRTG
jgi:serine protease